MGYGMVLMAQIGPWPSKKEPLSQTRKKILAPQPQKTPMPAYCAVVT